ncbi:heterokaryon incompatibility protein-domain-containing protein [Hypoxylon rubiginosum]|uniref:Heterokaryon incompatibility protein-domain-containing protein n=1 Tax=Hypoxylon rubiginosum TaxID=110542 RepID=A0ACB9ZF19_9PEZI|nr:heterokaryon incompatibility protein-domain-containing protein [Hypoxylon rubiginosum]
MTDCVVYDPLPVGYIRLLTIDCDDSQFLSGCLETVPLEDAPPYFALSYSWGAHKQDVPIYINGMALSISRSLAGALQRLRALAMDETESNQNIRVERMWIDRICIDQGNISERSHQVEYMGHIYSRAIRTLIWLQHEPEFYAAWQLLDKIYDVFRKEHRHAENLTDIPFRMYSDAYHASLGLPGWRDDSWESLRRLGQQLWFTRVWVIQEAVLSQQDPIILCGQVTYPWHRLGWVASWMRRNGYLRLPQVPNQLQNVDTIANIRRSSNCWRLDALLVATSIKFHATDQRDKVYALLGLAMERRTPKGIPDELTPNYELDVWQLYTNVARFLFRRYKTLPALTRTTGVKGDESRNQREYDFEQLPSWVPNWCDFTVVERMVAKSFSWVPFSGPTEIQTLGFPKHYNASSGLCAKFSDSFDPSVLRIHGLNIGKIVHIVQPAKQQSDEEYDHSSQMMSIWTTATRLLSSTNTATWIESYVKATTAEQYYLSGGTAEQFLQHGSAYLLRLLSHFPVQSMGVISPSDFQHLVNLLRVRSVGGDPELYSALAGNFCFNRSFFVTSNGYMGIGPSGAQVGDDIAVIFGGDVPYVLRREGNSFVFVGESYVQGLVNGEAVRDWRLGRLKEELIEVH